MVYDDYADIGIFAKWVMDAPEIGDRAHPSVGRRCPCTRKGIKLVLLTIIAISQPVFVWTFQIRKRLRISLPKIVDEGKTGSTCRRYAKIATAAKVINIKSNVISATI